MTHENQALKYLTSCEIIKVFLVKDAEKAVETHSCSYVNHSQYQSVNSSLENPNKGHGKSHPSTWLSRRYT